MRFSYSEPPRTRAQGFFKLMTDDGCYVRDKSGTVMRFGSLSAIAGHLARGFGEKWMEVPLMFQDIWGCDGGNFYIDRRRNDNEYTRL